MDKCAVLARLDSTTGIDFARKEGELKKVDFRCNAPKINLLQFLFA
jgi:hypothetical protein